MEDTDQDGQVQRKIGTVPQSPRIEADVLGAVLGWNQDATGAWRQIELLTNNEPLSLFYDNRNKVLARAIKTLIDKDSAISEASIEDQIVINGNESLIDEPRRFMIQLQTNSSITDFKDLRSSVNYLIERDMLRRQLTNVEKIRSEIVNDDLSPNEVSRELQTASVTNIMNKELQSSGELLLKLTSNDAKPPWTVSTGIAEIDKITNGGIEPGRNYVIAARPKIGKTSLATNICLNLLEEGSVVIFASLETLERDFMYKHIAAHAFLDQSKVREIIYGKATPEESFDDPEQLEAYREAYKFMIEAPLYPMFVGDMTSGFQSLISAIASAKSKHPGKPVVVIVDYLQLQVQNKFSELAELTQLTRDYKTTAVEMEVGIIYLSQLNRQGSDGAMPTSAMFRGSGTIEQDADLAMLLNRKAVYNDVNETDYPEHVMDVSVPLNRIGRPTTFKLYWDGVCNTVSDPDEGYEFQDDPF